MRRSVHLALLLSACAAVAPAAVLAQGTAAPEKPAVTSPFAADRAASVPSGLTPDGVAAPLAFPETPVVLAWGEVPGAAEYHVEVSDTPGFSRVVWEADTAETVAAPEVVLPDGEYWWRVRATDAAGTAGAWSGVARFAKTWPNAITGARLAAVPGGPAVSHLRLNPYLSWNAVPGAKSYDVQIAAGDGFAAPVLTGEKNSEPFLTPAAAGVLPDDTYAWRVRARDPKDNPGPWTLGGTFTKAWVAPRVVEPADGASVHDLSLRWEAVEGAESYEVQVTSREHNWLGSHLKVTGTTTSTSFTPTIQEVAAQGMTFGDHWWRVRPTVNGVTGTWSDVHKLTWRAPTPGEVTAPGVVQLGVAGDSDTGLMPRLAWEPVDGARIYRVDIATDPQFNHIVASDLTATPSWTPRTPLADNRVGTGYHWRVVWGVSATPIDPDWQIGEADATAASGTFRKQTRVTLGSPADGGVIQQPALLTWSPVPGVARYEVQLSRDHQFAGDATRTETVWGTGGVPGTMRDRDTRLPDGTWSWRVRAVDGGGAGQTWSPAGQFTLSSPRPAQAQPADGARVVHAPLLRWSPVASACGYQVQVSADPSFAGAEPLATAQTALVPPRAGVTTPGVNHWRVRADYCNGGAGQWSPARSFRSVRPPSFNLNSVPASVEYRRQMTVSGQLMDNGAPVRRARLHLERRLAGAGAYRPAGTVRTDRRGRYRFRLIAVRTADYRLVWRGTAAKPGGAAAFSLKVKPRVTFRLAAGRVVRTTRLLVRGSVFPRRPAVVQVRSSDGWETVRRVAPTSRRFAVRIGTGRLGPGRVRLRLLVPRDAGRRFVAASSRQRGVLVYDRFVVR
ncbi:DUF4962 domain-containing protein [Miltoncostaea marina]|uniref:DUF4962 domain-containing protein n=1 Tax=Miltoncostaea marina TaxID=2843215 RepID=UPI001C3E2BE9|nr:DUF4962 domain-containing protein [Miltoncostaea marina]